MNNNDLGRQVADALRKAWAMLKRGLDQLWAALRRLVADTDTAITAWAAARVERFCESHYLFTEHPDLVAVDGYLDRWY